MLISIIVPVYNAENRLRNTLESILSQSSDDYEIILINDGSKDNSRDICDEFADKYNHIRVIHQENAGPSVARNRGILEAKGKYLGFVDADDQLDKDWFSFIKNAISQYEPDLIITGYRGMYYEVNNLVTRYIKIPTENFVEGNRDIIKMIQSLINDGLFNPLWNKVYNRKIIVDNLINLNPMYKLGEDFLFNLDYFSKTNNMYIMNKSLYCYMNNNEGLTHSFVDNKFDKLKGVSLEFRDFLLKNDITLVAYYERLVRNIFSSTMELFHKSCNFNFSEKIDEINHILKDKDVKDLVSSYKPESLRDKLLLIILKLNSAYIIMFFSKLFHYKKFVIDKR